MGLDRKLLESAEELSEDETDSARPPQPRRVLLPEGGVAYTPETATAHSLKKTDPTLAAWIEERTKQKRPQISISLPSERKLPDVWGVRIRPANKIEGGFAQSSSPRRRLLHES
jgi:hypothetical protein